MASVSCDGMIIRIAIYFADISTIAIIAIINIMRCYCSCKVIILLWINTIIK